MGVTLWDMKDGNTEPYYVQSRAWRAMVEAIKRLSVLSNERSERLHDLWHPDAMLTAVEAQRVAASLETNLLPQLDENKFVLPNGDITSHEGTKIDWEEWRNNWLVSVDVLESFCDYCRRCEGFSVRQ